MIFSRQVVAALLLGIGALANSSVRAAELDKGHRILLQRGLQIQALVFWDSPFDLKQMQSAGFNCVNWGWKSRMELLGPPPGFFVLKV